MSCSSVAFLTVVSMWAVQSGPQGDFAVTTAICVATSDDNLQFNATGELFVHRGATPAVVRLGNGELLAVFQHASDSSGKDGTSRLYASRSKDDGKSWGAARAVQIEGLAEGIEVRSPALILMPSGLVRMYFVGGEQINRARARDRSTAAILSAVTRNGAAYQMDREVRIRLNEAQTVRLSAYQADKQMVLLAEVGSGRNRPGVVHQFVSGDRRAFLAGRRGRQSGPVGHVLQLDPRHWRMFLPAGGSIYSRISRDGLRWRSESGARLEDAWEATVAATGKTSSVMLFSRPVRASDAKIQPLVSVGDKSRTSPAEFGASGEGEASGDDAAVRSGDDESGDSIAGSGRWFDDFTSADYGTELGEDWMSSAGAGSDAVLADHKGFAPLPDFRNRIDYVTWFEQQVTLPADQNAFHSYEFVREAMLALPDEAFKDRYNSGQFSGPPSPWDAAAHPEWEASYQAQQEMLATLRAAAHDPRPYALEPTWSERTSLQDRTLWGLLLPGLAQLRGANKANLSQAWRMEGGIVPPERMREAISTGLGLASHLQQGPTLIERLVAGANRMFTLEDARWALHSGVFNSADQLEATLTMLQERDLPDDDPGFWIRFEHAAAMDTLQHLFEPAEPGGQPTLRKERIEPLFGGIPPREKLENMTLSVEDAAVAAQACDRFWRELEEDFEASWPYPMPESPDQIAGKYWAENELADILVPSIHRACEILRRVETSRRATRLAYSIELYRARQGRYPTSLDELPYEQTYDIRLDPFSGTDFVYRLTDDGPLLYSTSVNGLDDGGVHSRVWGDNDVQVESDDFVFWPVQE